MGALSRLSSEVAKRETLVARQEYSSNFLKARTISILLTTVSLMPNLEPRHKADAQ